MKKLSLLLLTLTVLVLSSSEITAIKLNDCSFGFKTKRFFNSIRNMSTREKNKELREYAQDSVPSRGWIGSLYGTSRFFNPSKEYVSEILYLIEHGADANLPISYNRNATFKPIYLFIENNDLESTRFLLEHGARVDEPIIGESHPLLFAYTKEMAKLLIEHDAQIENTYSEVDTWAKGTIKRNIFETVCLSKYDPELILLYLAQLEEEKRKEQAQTMLNRLVHPDTLELARYDRTDAFKQKRDYLIKAGAQEELVPESSSTSEGDWSLSDSRSR